jgi:hypothetical protein
MADSFLLDNESIRQISSSSESPDELSEAQPIDNLTERGTRFLYQSISRRGFLSTVGKAVMALVGVALVPLLPVDREVQVAEAAFSNCNSWYMCGAFADRICSCACGGLICQTCPSGTNLGSSWTSCCYDAGCACGHLVSYKDCCYSGSMPACCDDSGCECYRGQPANWCGTAGTLCCTMVCINYNSYC